MVVLIPLASSRKTAAPPTLNEHLKVFEPLLGKTFRGEFPDSTPDMPKFDVSHWERAMNGQAVRILHSVNDGAYGGESIIMWTRPRTRSTIGTSPRWLLHRRNDGCQWASWTSIEKVTGNANGITEVRATSTLSAEGDLLVSSKYLSNGAWEKGHELHYKPAPNAKVIFQ